MYVKTEWISYERWRRRRRDVPLIVHKRVGPTIILIFFLYPPKCNWENKSPNKKKFRQNGVIELPIVGWQITNFNLQ